MFENIINLFYPKVCLGCNSLLLSSENVICTRCRHEIPMTLHHLNIENEAFKKFYGKIPVEFAATFIYFHKKGIVQQLIHNLKYKGHEEIGTVLADWYSQDLKSIEILETIDEIIPVPLHKRKMRERGYNQVTSFGKTLATNLNVPFNETLLIRTKYSKTQTRKNLLNRIDVNNETLFDVKFDSKDHNKHFLLIDDVLTTGSTLEACGKALLKIPGAKISIVCMSMSH
jgi:ComF family protein